MHKHKPKVFLTRRIPGAAVQQLKKSCQVKIYPKDQVIPRKELLKGARWCDALLCLLTDKIDKEVIDANPHLKVISNYAVGYDNIDVEYATRKGIPVCHTPCREATDAVAEHTLALLFGLAKRLYESNAYIREGKWQSWAPSLLLGTLLRGKTLGLIGLGRIGGGVAERAQCLGMKVIYHDVIRNREMEKKSGLKFVSMKTVLKNSDFISLHVPLLPSTYHLIGARELKTMKKTACLINTARGPVVDEKALIEALERKQIAGAGLDVYEQEPRINPRLAKLGNVLLTPHTASSTREVREQMTKDAVENILTVLQGKKAGKTVNEEVYNRQKKKK